MDTDARRLAITNVIETARLERAGWAGPCSACKWASNSGLRNSCANPVSLLSRFDKREGLREGQPQQTMRRVDGLCGPEGMLFENLGWRRALSPWKSKSLLGAAFQGITAGAGLVAAGLMIGWVLANLVHLVTK